MQTISTSGHTKHEFRKREQRIEQLPPHLVAKIKSSAAIISLDQVVCGLLENALDADATRVVIQIARSRGTCVVDDDGTGIAPIEFSEQGGLCKVHYTSKQSGSTETHGRHGTFLASLAALSLLAVTSKHESYHSTNRLVVHRTDVLSRLTPVVENSYLIDSRHGSQVSVQDLFGNMPVRVKHRQLDSSSAPQANRLFTLLRLKIIAHLLAWPRDATVRLWDIDSEIVVLLSNRKAKLPLDRSGNTASTLRPLIPTILLHDLMPDQKWIPASARSKNLAINGVIGLKPVASRLYQFLSFGIRPVFAENEDNELYNHINTIFKNSSFGSLNDTLHEAGTEQQRHGTNDRIRIKDLRLPRKGVDRWPMLYLCLNFRETSFAAIDSSNYGQTLDLILSTLTSLVTQWLRAQHIALGTADRQRSESSAWALPRQPEYNDTAQDEHQSSPGEKSCKDDDSRMVPNRTTERAMSARSFSLRHFPGRKSATEAVAYNDSLPYSIQKRTEQSASVIDTGLSSHEHDPTTVWTDPITQRKQSVNARTGMSELARPMGSRLTLRLSSAPMPGKPIAWLNQIRHSWQNPVFNPTEGHAPQLGKSISNLQALVGHNNCRDDSDGHPSSINIGVGHTGHKLSKDALTNFRFIAQVDRRFILAALPIVHQDSNAPEELVIIDQHAADERVKVEALYADICDRTRSKDDRSTQLIPPLLFELASQEVELLISHSSYFDKWDIRYSLVKADKESSDNTPRLQVNTISSLIADRCKAEPQLLLSTLRHHIWNSKPKQHQTKDHDDESIAADRPFWLHQIGDCPQGMIDMLNSRACRSAIMFNDLLSSVECKMLITRLAKCAFPFQCAHGRPSMVPMLRMQSQPMSRNTPNSPDINRKGSFLDAYEFWNDE